MNARGRDRQRSGRGEQLAKRGERIRLRRAWAFPFRCSWSTDSSIPWVLSETLSETSQSQRPDEPINLRWPALGDNTVSEGKSCIFAGVLQDAA